MMTLNQLALNANTDRSGAFHAYTETYDKLFTPLRDQPIRLLEMGVLNGAGLQMWSWYFTNPETEIIGIDIHPEWCRTIVDPRVKVMGASYYDPAFWDANGDFDLCIDDSNHITSAQVDAFNLGWGHVKPGGMWIVEDTHSVYSTQLTNTGTNIIQHFSNIATKMQDRRGAEGCAAPDPSNPYHSILSIEHMRGLTIVRKRP